MIKSFKLFEFFDVDEFSVSVDESHDEVLLSLKYKEKSYWVDMTKGEITEVYDSTDGIYIEVENDIYSLFDKYIDDNLVEDGNNYKILSNNDINGSVSKVVKSFLGVVSYEGINFCFNVDVGGYYTDDEVHEFYFIEEGENRKRMKEYNDYVRFGLKDPINEDELEKNLMEYLAG